VLNAGLYPRLRERNFLPVDVRLDYTAGEALGEQAIRQIRSVFDRQLADATPPRPGESLWVWVHRKDVTFRKPDGSEVKPVFVFDQFEEIFTLGAESVQSEEFLQQLADLVENRPPRSLVAELKENLALSQSLVFGRQDYRVLICIREDYVACLDSLAPRMPSVGENRMRLVQMDGAQAFQAVNNPGRQITTPLVSRQIVRKVAALRHRQKVEKPQASDETWEGLKRLRVEPAFLSLVCRELNRWRKQKDFPQITSELVSETGAIETILTDFYERSIGDQPAAVRIFVEDELLTKEGFRESKSLDVAEEYLAEHGADPAALKVLVNRRLLRFEERLEVKRLELTHDILAEVVRASRDTRRAHEEKEALERQQRQAEEARRKAVALEKETRRRLYAARFTIAVMFALLA
jgi:hypothetical protein